MAMAINRILNVYILNGAMKLKFPSSDITRQNQYISMYGIRQEEYISGTIREHRQQSLSKSRRQSYFVPFASANDNITPNGVQQKNLNIGMEELSQNEIRTTGLVKSIHDAARYAELAIREHSSSLKISWFSKAWLGVDKNAWIKTLSYQVSMYALLQAAIEISSRGERGDHDTNIFVKRSLLRQCTSLEMVIREELLTKQQELYEWYWSHQHNMILKMYIDLLEEDPKFSAATMLYWKGEHLATDSDTSLVLLALSCLAAIKHLGSAKVSCSPFYSMLPDTIGRLMDMLVDFVAIQKTYHSMKDIGLRNEFLFHFGPRAASVKYNNDNRAEEIMFWIGLVQNQLKMAIDREKIWSRLTTSESIEVLEKDLAIFGFFIALGRSTKSFLSTNGVPVMNDQIDSIIRFLIGGSVLYYPQLSSISSYQMYVEVVCEELEWLPFYPSDVSEPKIKQGGMSYKAALSVVLDVCSYWMTSFIKYSAWLENPSNIKATRFLSKGHSKLIECMKDIGISEMTAVEDAGSQGSEMDMSFENELDYFDKALENVEEALNKLENLLQEWHLSNSNTNKDDLKAACSDLERLRKLKKEAEFLEASLRAKAALLGQGNIDEVPPSSTNNRRWFPNKEAKESESAKRTAERLDKEPFWRYLVPNSSRINSSGLPAVGQNVKSALTDNRESDLDEIRRFELLRRELIELEKRVQKSTDAKNEEVLESGNRIIASTRNNEQKKDDVIAKSIEKIKETSTDVLQGTQLLAIDVAAAMVLLRRAVTGDELAEKEKKALQRTLTDLASVIPIGVLMLLPVTAVGHAAMLAAIQRYAPSLIPSTYGPERLGLLRQLEKVKETEIVEMSSDEMTEVINSSGSNKPQ